MDSIFFAYSIVFNSDSYSQPVSLNNASPLCIFKINSRGKNSAQIYVFYFKSYACFRLKTRLSQKFDFFQQAQARHVFYPFQNGLSLHFFLFALTPSQRPPRVRHLWHSAARHPSAASSPCRPPDLVCPSPHCSLCPPLGWVARSQPSSNQGEPASPAPTRVLGNVCPTNARMYESPARTR